MGDHLDADSLASLPTPSRGRRGLSADESHQARQVLAAHYENGATIRGLADASGYSFGRVRELLLEAGVTLRRRGGPQRSTPRES
ncbi:helix-turn-helix domain-containing protein [Actinomycetospora endophytica]|uniref:Helix-turn-helix domain-containing protein n=1 Tax=Actinomycetospora endophytica TaxID=2291215 RepID=A0ABS8PHA6_9PSEU|nr:helix-turn-helix domain-containing protein [Actinomycetospora endophytica]MCD2197622.1 helix-turn-helix domain-containing protein [Actinomycetospora endophytica]